MALGVGFLHDLDPPILHCNLKPQNVIIDDNGDAMVCDFDIYPDIQTCQSLITYYADEHQSVGYQAPELVIEDDMPYSKASDVYAFGCLILQVGRAPAQRT